MALPPATSCSEGMRGLWGDIARDTWPGHDSWSGDSAEPQKHQAAESILEPRKPFKNQQQLNQMLVFLL